MVSETTSPGKWNSLASLFHGAWSELRTPSERRNYALDGLRTIAILLVVNLHMGGAFERAFGACAYTRSPATKGGWAGVDLFFVLSGFLIGGQLWKELAASRRIDFFRFIMRRGLRIWPLYVVMFVVAAIVYSNLLAARHYGWSDLLFVTNYTYGSLGLVNGSWSLCAEEQFYIFAPLLLILVGHRSAKTYRWILASLLIAEVLFRAWKFHHLTGHLLVRNTAAMQVLYFPLHTHSDGLLVGLLVANFSLYQRKPVGRLWPWLGMAVGLVTLGGAALIHMEYMNFLGLALFFGGAVWLSTARTIHLFDHHVFYLLSRLSFGMYLNHEYLEGWSISMLSRTGIVHLNQNLAGVVGFLVLILISAALAALTFFLVEHPFLVLRTRILQPVSAAPIVAH